MTDRVEPHRMFAQVLDQLAGSARRVAEKPQDFPTPPDLVAELAACANQLDHVARVIEAGYPELAAVLHAHATRARIKVRLCRELGHAA